MLHWAEYAKVFVAFIVIVDPIGNVPIFLSLTAAQSAAERRRTSVLTALGVAGVLIGAVVVGEWVLKLFSIGVAHFRVGGGILLLMMVISMFHARLRRSKHTPEEAEEAADRATLAMVPLATPLLAGPGSISTAIIYADKGTTWWHALILCAVVALVAAVVWVTLRLATLIGARLGQTGINVATRLMGLILAAIAVEFITTGLAELLPGLAG